MDKKEVLKQIVLVENAIYPISAKDSRSGKRTEPFNMGNVYVEINATANLFDAETSHIEDYIPKKEKIEYYNSDVFKDPGVMGLVLRTPIAGSDYVNQTANERIKRRPHGYPLQIKVPLDKITNQELRKAILENTYKKMQSQKKAVEQYRAIKPENIERAISRAHTMKQSSAYDNGKGIKSFVSNNITEYIRTLRFEPCAFLIRHKREELERRWLGLYGQVEEKTKPDYKRKQLAHMENVIKHAYDIPNNNIVNLISIENGKTSIAKLSNSSIITFGKKEEKVEEMVTAQ